MPEGCKGKVELLIVDVSNEASVKSAAATLKTTLGDSKLFALVNNAGVGLAHTGQTASSIVVTNSYGVHWMTENFVSLIDPAAGRIVHVGSGIGSMYTGKQSDDDIKGIWNNPNLTWDQLDAKL